MTSQVLDRTLSAYRIGDPAGAYPIFDATGSTIAPGRWNTPGSPIVYTAEHYSTALLEKLVHGSGRLPPNQHYIEIEIPVEVSVERVDLKRVKGWDAEDRRASQAFGDRWHEERRSAVLIVPSLAAPGVEWNVAINQDHPETAKLKASALRPVVAHPRLLA